MDDNRIDVLLLRSPKKIRNDSLILTIVLILIAITLDLFFLKSDIKRSSQTNVVRMAGHIPSVISYSDYLSHKTIAPEEVDVFLEMVSDQIRKTLSSEVTLRDDKLEPILMNDKQVDSYLKRITNELKNEYYQNWETTGIPFSILAGRQEFKKNLLQILSKIESELINTPYNLFIQGIRIPKEIYVDIVVKRWFLYFIPFLIGIGYFCREMFYRFEVKQGWNFNWNWPSLSVMPGGPPDTDIPSSFGRTFSTLTLIGLILKFFEDGGARLYQYRYTLEEGIYFLSISN